MDGDSAALDAVWRAHRRWVAAVLVAHLPRDADIDDVLQDVAVAVVSHIGQLEDPNAFRSWLRAIALNAARSVGRGRARARGPGGARGSGEVADPDGLADPRLPGVELEQRVTDALAQVARLPVELREPLLLRAVHGLSQREIAATLGVPETTVETRLARARRRLRNAAEPGPGPPDSPSEPACNGWHTRRIP